MYEMIGSSAVVQDEYPNQDLIPQSYFNREEKVAEVPGFTDLELLVLDAHSGRPISKAMISIDMLGRTAVCDNQGRVLIKKVLSASFVVDVIVPGYIAGSKKINLSALESNSLTVQMIRNS